ncbi:DNA polymerase III subunit beta [Hymenobacter saemangeumensis]|uniref:Beta sliding clamp n=1 Tax=Hymenobacter saemangeumensis TaxID=1084522 RepID=A0ABP8I2S1_9BACT
MPKFIVSSSALLKALAPLAAVITNNPVVPILENFVFHIEDGKLTLTASDLEVFVVTSLPVEAGKGDVFSICVPARILSDVLKQLPDQPITITVDLDENRVQIQTANGRYKLAAEDASQYPRKPEPGSRPLLELPSSVLQRAISKTRFAISTDELRPAMCGVLVQLTRTQLTFVATDGHRLLRYRRTDLGAGEERNLIIPRKAWNLLKNLLPSDATIVATQFSQSQAFFTFNQYQVMARLIDERYPDYENVLPVSNPNVLLINRTELLQAVRRCALVSNKMTHQVRLKLADAELTISAEDLDFSNEGTETLACQYDGDAMTIGFNAQFVQECLTNLDSEEVTLSMNNPDRAGLLAPTQAQQGEDVLMLVMPVMLNQYV